jgi:hypothetical protein
MGKTFETGNLVATAAVVDEMKGHGERTEKSNTFSFFVADCYERHCEGDWGDLCKEDAALNEEAINGDGRLFSVYEPKGFPLLNSEDHKIYIITEADRSVTTILFPMDY